MKTCYFLGSYSIYGGTTYNLEQNTVLRAGCIQNKKVYGWKRARPQTSFNSTCVAFDFGIPVAFTLISKTGNCI